MIRLHYANRLENLIAPLAQSVAERQRSRPLDRIPIIVPNRVVEQFVRLRLSEAIGVAANLEFPFLRAYLGRVAQEANPGLMILEAEPLQVVLFECLRNAIRSDAPEIQAVRNYAEAGSKTPTDAELRLFHLSEQAARLFREYSITRRPMLRGWQNGAQIDKSPFDEAERWQRYLWGRVFAPDGGVRPPWIENDDPEHQRQEHDHRDGEPRWMLLSDGFDATESRRLESALPPVLHVFGLAYAGPAFARIFARLGELAELHIYALNPCMEFWEDVDNPSGIARDSWVRRGQRIGNDPESAEDPFALDVVGDNPALRLWARPGREYIRTLNELTDCDFDAHFTHPGAAVATGAVGAAAVATGDLASGAGQCPSTLLRQLQESILIREAERRPKQTGDASQNDGSIRFLASPGIRREAEIVANTIWSLVQDKADRPLRFHEIAVVVPDRAQDDYLPHVEAAFARLHEIPVNIVNRRFATQSRVAEAVGLLLRLPLGRFTRDEVLRLLTHPAIAGADPEIDSERWPKWCDALGVYFGADEQDLAGTYIRRDVFHWDQALKRLALGVFMTGQRSFFEAPGGLQLLPYEVPQAEVPDAASLVRTARGLLSDACDIRSQRLTLGQWSRLLSNFVLTYVRAADSIDERIRDHCVGAIESIATSGIRSDPVPYEIACEFATARISDVESRRAQFTGGGVAVGALSALRSVPFRVIFVLAMNENGFPERSSHDPLDLRLARRVAGDVTPAERDRYLFLETLLAARDRIFMSYVSRDPQTGDPLEPSTLIRELQFILRGYLDGETLKGLTVEHPVSRYDRHYFADLDSCDSRPHQELFSFDSNARRGARMAALRRNLAEHCGGVPLPGRDEPFFHQLAPDVRNAMRPSLRISDLPAAGKQAAVPPEIRLPLAALRKFLECPLQGSARYALGMVEDDEGAGEDRDDEPLAQSVLDRTVLLREVFRAARGDRELAIGEYADAFRIAQAQGRAPVGTFADEAEKVDLERLRGWIDQAREASADGLANWQEIRIGRADEFERADRLLPEIALSVRIRHLDGSSSAQTAKIYGTVGLVSPDLDASLRCTLSKEPKAKDFLGLFLCAIALAAAGEAHKQKFRAIVLASVGASAAKRMKSFTPPSREDALEYLAGLASDLLSSEKHYFLPIEAVEEVWKQMRGAGAKADLLDSIYGVRENDFHGCSSDYGPVRNARRFEPPKASDVREIVQRRFGLLAGIFDD